VLSYRNCRPVAVLGLPLDNVTMDEAMELIEEKIEEQGFHQVTTANVDFITNAIHDHSLQEMLCSCDLVVPEAVCSLYAATSKECRGPGIDEPYFHLPLPARSWLWQKPTGCASRTPMVGMISNGYGRFTDFCFSCAEIRCRKIPSLLEDACFHRLADSALEGTGN
jgi:hypothetical protein